MSVIRVHKNKNFTVMSNVHLRDMDLSLKAKGLLSVMLSLPDNWNYSIAGLCSICKENETAIKSTIRELKERRYVIVDKKYPNQTQSKKYEYVYNIFEEPQPENQWVEKQGIENLPLDNLPIEDNHLNKRTDIQSTDKLNTDEVNTNGLNTDKNSFSKEKDIKSNSPEGERSNSFSREKKTPAPKPNKRHSEKEMEDMVNQMSLRARKIAYEMTGNKNKSQNVYNCVEYFLEKHKEHSRERHKVLKDETLRKIVFKFVEGIEIERDGYMDMYDGLASTKEYVGDYREVINEYFNTEFKGKCDYSLVHFSGDTVLTNMMNHVGKEDWCESM